MKQVIKLRMLPSEAQAAALGETLQSCNAAAVWLAQQMHSARVFRKIDSQHCFYRELRERFGLAAQPAVRVIAKVANAYATMRSNLRAGKYGPPGSVRRISMRAKAISFRADAAQPFGARCLSWQIPDAIGAGHATVSIWTVRGRLRRVRVIAARRDLVKLTTGPIGETEVKLTTGPIGETDLIHRDGNWFLHATIDVPEIPSRTPANGFIGVDMGIVNLATTSDGARAAGARLNRYRKRQIRLRKRL